MSQLIVECEGSDSYTTGRRYSLTVREVALTLPPSTPVCLGEVQSGLSLIRAAEAAAVS